MMTRLDQEQELASPKENAAIPEPVRLLIVNALYWSLKNTFKIEISEESLANAKALDTLLLTSSVVTFGYHSTSFDTLILPLFLSKLLKNSDTILAPAAITHYKGVKKMFLNVMSMITHSQILPVVRKRDEAKYGLELKQILLQQLIETTKIKLAQAGNLYAVAPMGSRERALNSESVNQAFANVAQIHKIPLVPVAFTKTDNGLELHVGEILNPPTSPDDVDDAVNAYMSALALMLPKELRGDY